MSQGSCQGLSSGCHWDGRDEKEGCAKVWATRRDGMAVMNKLIEAPIFQRDGESVTLDLCYTGGFQLDTGDKLTMVQFSFEIQRGKTECKGCSDK